MQILPRESGGNSPSTKVSPQDLTFISPSQLVSGGLPDLAHPLPGEVKSFAYLRQREGLFAAQTIAHGQYRGLTGRKGPRRVRHVRPQRIADLSGVRAIPAVLENVVQAVLLSAGERCLDGDVARKWKNPVGDLVERELPGCSDLLTIEVQVEFVVVYA